MNFFYAITFIYMPMMAYPVFHSSQSGHTLFTEDSQRFHDKFYKRHKILFQSSFQQQTLPEDIIVNSVQLGTGYQISDQKIGFLGEILTSSADQEGIKDRFNSFTATYKKFMGEFRRRTFWGLQTNLRFSPSNEQIPSLYNITPLVNIEMRNFKTDYNLNLGPSLSFGGEKSSFGFLLRGHIGKEISKNTGLNLETEYLSLGDGELRAFFSLRQSFGEFINLFGAFGVQNSLGGDTNIFSKESLSFSISLKFGFNSRNDTITMNTTRIPGRVQKAPSDSAVEFDIEDKPQPIENQLTNNELAPPTKNESDSKTENLPSPKLDEFDIANDDAIPESGIEVEIRPQMISKPKVPSPPPAEFSEPKEEKITQIESPQLAQEPPVVEEKNITLDQAPTISAAKKIELKPSVSIEKPPEPKKVVKNPRPSLSKAHPVRHQFTRKLIINFPFDRWDISSKAENRLRQILERIRRSSPVIKRVFISGHTDTTGDKEYNDYLSVKRVISVASYLTNRGIPASTLFGKGYGENQLLVNPEKSERDFAKNRRAEFEIIIKTGANY